MKFYFSLEQNGFYRYNKSMSFPSSLYSIRSEGVLLGGLIKNPKFIVELESHITEKVFFHNVHRVCFSVLKNLVFSGKEVDKVVLAQKLIEISVLKFEDINVYDYLDSLSFTNINLNGVKDLSKELLKLQVKRELFSNANEIQKFITESGDKPLNEIISKTDAMYNEKINSYISDDLPSDLFAEAESIINDRVNNPVDLGVETPFPIFNDMFGNLRVGITAICGRAKNNKSTILLNIGFGGILHNPKLKILYLDTELKKYDHVFRSMSALSQMHTSYLEEGNWVKNVQLTEKLQNAYKVSNTLKGKLFHHYIGNRSIEEIQSIIKRWFFSVVGRGNPGLVILDYIKIGDEKLSNYNGEHQELGRKINCLNAISQDLNIPILTSMQLNRSAITDNKEDESAISMTDRLSWFANGVFIFRKKRPDEISEEGIKFGTHKLVPVVLRYQGKNTSLLDLVKVGDNHGKPCYKQNFINYNFSHFRLEERGTLRDIIMDKSLSKPLQKEDKNKEQIAI